MKSLIVKVSLLLISFLTTKFPQIERVLNERYKETGASEISQTILEQEETKNQDTTEDSITDLESKDKTKEEVEVETVYVTPDYSELIEKLRVRRQCWRDVEKKTISAREKDCGHSEKMGDDGCIYIIRNKEVDYPEDEKNIIIDNISKGIDKLKQGIFVDIYDQDEYPTCPEKESAAKPLEAVGN